MRLYENSTNEFVNDVLFNELTPKLVKSFEKYYGHKPSPSEVNSWKNSLQYVKNFIEANRLYDNAIALEYELPYTTKRIDCLLFGKDLLGKDNMVVIELKQWSKVEDCGIEGNVYTFIGGKNRMVAHPSIQVSGYHYFLKDFVQIFSENNSVNLNSCVYCHNYEKKDNDPLFSNRFERIVREFPVFTREDVKKLGEYLRERLAGGHGIELLNRFRESPIKPSKKLLDFTSQIIKEKQKAFSLLDEQIVASNTILDRAKKASRAKKKTVIIVKGGPGTGKSVIALNIMAELLSKGLQVFHATGSKTFTETIRKIVGRRSTSLFKYFNSFTEKKFEENQIDVLICDEAHRIRETSNNRYTKRSERSEIPQVEELVKAAKVSVFFIDDFQVVKPTEIGNSQLIKNAAKKYNAELFEFELKTQFRCNGSNGYLDWINNILEIGEPNTKIYLTEADKFDFRIFDSPEELYAEIQKKNQIKPNSARLVAGFCWPWSDTLNPDGTLKKDVKIGSFEMAWEAREKYKGNSKLAKGIPLWYQWPYDPNGVNQIGCIYTVQGFEFDYIGVIFGRDLRYDPKLKTWIADKNESKDPNLNKKRLSDEEFMKYVKNVYRVLLTRGMKGCYVYFVDEGTRKHFEERIKFSQRWYET